MRSIRSILDEDILALKGATEVCFKLGGGMTSFSSLTRYVVSELSKFASTTSEWMERIIPVDVAIEADRRAKSPIIIGEAARQLGFRLEPLAAAITGSGPLTEAEILKVMDEATDVWRETRAAYSDGHLDELDKKRLRKELRELIRAAEHILAKLEEE